MAEAAASPRVKSDVGPALICAIASMYFPHFSLLAIWALWRVWETRRAPSSRIVWAGALFFSLSALAGRLVTHFF